MALPESSLGTSAMTIPPTVAHFPTVALLFSKKKVFPTVEAWTWSILTVPLIVPVVADAGTGIVRVIPSASMEMVRKVEFLMLNIPSVLCLGRAMLSSKLAVDPITEQVGFNWTDL
jgi:hypothetical protein